MSAVSRREFLETGLGAGVGLAAGVAFPSRVTAQTKAPIKAGVLHSLSGTMAISEVSLRDVVLMAVEEINTKGGVLGRKIEPVVVDPASNWTCSRRRPSSSCSRKRSPSSSAAGRP